MNVLWIVLCYLLPKVSSNSLPLVRWHPRDGVKEGDTLRLECQVSPLVSGPAIWLKLDPKDPNNHELLSHGELLIRQDDRFSVAMDRDSNTFALMIKEISVADEGGYQCQVPIKHDEEEVQAAPPVIISLTSDNGDHFSSGTLPPPRGCPVSVLTACLCAFTSLYVVAR